MTPALLEPLTEISLELDADLARARSGKSQVNFLEQHLTSPWFSGVGRGQDDKGWFIRAYVHTEADKPLCPDEFEGLPVLKVVL